MTIFEYATVLIVGDVEMAASVHRDADSIAQIAGGGMASAGVEITRTGSKVALPEYSSGDGTCY
jgi:hypothetical protein